MRPWKKLEHDIWNIANTVITSIVSISLVAVTLSGVVRQSRALTGMAVLQVLYSLVVDGVTVHRYFRDKGNDLKEREGMRWDLTPWLLVLLVASLVNSQFLGTLNGVFDTSLVACLNVRGNIANMSPIRTIEIDRNPRLNGVTGFYNTTKSTDPTGLALVICAMVGGALAVLAFLLGGCCSVFGRSGRYRSARSSLIAVYIFSFFALVSCLGFILVVDYAVGVVTGNAEGNAAKLKGKGSQAMFWTFFVFQYVPLFTF